MFGVLFVAAGAGRIYVERSRCGDRPLKRQLGSPALFGIVQGFIAASIYFSTGLVAERALGLDVGGVPGRRRAVRGDRAVLRRGRVAAPGARRGDRDRPLRASTSSSSFIAGWAICLDYLILVALCAFATTDYLGMFWSGSITGSASS